MLEALLWITGFLSILLLTWFVGKYYAESIATRRFIKHRRPDNFFYTGPEDSTSHFSEEQTSNHFHNRLTTPKLRLAAKDGKLINPEETFTEPSTELTKASK